MPLISRRMRMLALGLLVLAASLLFPPTRTWLARACLRWCFESEIQLGNLQVYPNHGLVALEDLQVPVAGESSVLDVHVPQAWLLTRGAEMQKGLSVPRIHFDNVLVSMPATWCMRPRGEAGAPIDPGNDSHNDAPDCHATRLADQMHAFMFAKEVESKWRPKIAAWIAEAQVDFDTLQTIDSGLDLGSSSSASRSELEAALRLCSEMSERQDYLVEQFVGVRKLLTAECNQLRSSFESELARLDCTDLSGQPATIPERLTQELFEKAAAQFWRRYASYAKLVCVLSQRLHSKTNNAVYDRSFYHARTPQLEFGVMSMTADGLFRNGDHETAFQARGSCRFRGIDRATGESQMRYQFMEPETLVDIKIEHSRHQSGGLVMQLAAVPYRVVTRQFGTEASPSDIAPTGLPQTTPTSSDEPTASLRLSIVGQSLKGTLLVPLDSDCLRSTIGQLGAESAWILASATKQERSGLEVTIRGTWNRPEWIADTRTQLELVPAIETERKTSSDESMCVIRQRIRNRFAAQLTRIEQLISQAAEARTLIIKRDRPRLEYLRKVLQRRLEEVTTHHMSPLHCRDSRMVLQRVSILPGASVCVFLLQDDPERAS